MKLWDDDYLNFSRKARRGAIVFLLIFMVILVVQRVIEKSNSEILQIEHFQITPPIIAHDKETQQELLPTKAKYNIPDSSFNPNDFDVDDWQNMGLTKKQSESILKYRNSGGVFRVKKDVAKMYVISNELYELIADKILLPDSLPNKKTNYNKFKQTIIDLNEASLVELKYIRGIGPYYAQKILNYREKLGGFYSFEQLNEISLMNQSIIDSLKNYFQLSPEKIIRQNINTIELSELIAHPYIRLSVGKEIINLRDSVGIISDINELKKCNSIESALLDRIKYYFKLDD